MKKLILILSLIACTLLQAQTVIKNMYTVDAGGTKRAGVIILPGGYDPAVASPVIAFFHGVGEAYYLSDTGTLNKIFANGCPLVQARNGLLNVVINPLDGKAYKPIVVGLQGIIPPGQSQGWAPTAAQMAYFIRNTVMVNYKVNTNAVFATGLSAGGQETHYSLSTPGVMDLYAAGFPLSSAASLSNFSQMAAQGIRVWGEHGDSDPTCSYKNTTVYSADPYNAIKPGFYRVTLIPSGGHGGWDNMYRLTNREDIKDVNGTSYLANYVEWFLMNMKGTTFTPAPQTTTQPPAGNTSTAVVAKLSVTITGRSAAFTPAGTTGVTSWDLKLVDSATNSYYKPDWSGSTNGNSNPSILPTASNIKDGKWKAMFTCQPGNVVATASVNIGNVVVTPPPGPTKVIHARLSLGYVEVVIYKDSNGIYSADINQ
jgi:hypothetical protein